MLAKNKSKEAKLEKILPKTLKVNGEQVLCGIKMFFSGEHPETMSYEPNGSEAIAEQSKDRKPVKVPNRSKGMIVVLV